MLDFNYNNIIQVLTISLLSDRKEFKNKQFVFEDIIYFEYDNVDYWMGDGIPFDCISYDKDCTKYNMLVKKNNDNRKPEWSFPTKLKCDIVEVSFYNLSGGSITIVCRRIVCNEFDT